MRDIEDKFQDIIKQLQQIFDELYLYSKNNQIDGSQISNENFNKIIEIVFTSISFPLARLYNEIYGMKDESVRKALITLIDDLNESFKSLNVIPVYNYEYFPPANFREEDSKYKLIASDIKDITKEDAELVIIQVGFCSKHSVIVPMGYILRAKVNQNKSFPSSNGVEYPFKQNEDFILKGYFQGNYKNMIFEIEICSKKMNKKFRKLISKGVINIGYKYKRKFVFYEYEHEKSKISRCMFEIKNESILLFKILDASGKESKCIPLAKIELK